jgi:hypothetical protein
MMNDAWLAAQSLEHHAEWVSKEERKWVRRARATPPPVLEFLLDVGIDGGGVVISSGQVSALV